MSCVQQRLITITLAAGRAIRHKNDWSMLVLVDTRYHSEKIHGKLPKWIGKSLVVTQSFDQAILCQQKREHHVTQEFERFVYVSCELR